MRKYLYFLVFPITLFMIILFEYVLHLNSTITYLIVFIVFFFTFYILWYRLYYEEKENRDSMKQVYKNQNKKTREVYEKTNALMRSLPIPLIVVSPRFEVVLYNKAMLSFASVLEERVQTLTMFDFRVVKFIKDHIIIGKKNEGLIWIEEEAYSVSCIPLDEDYLFVFQNITKSIEGERMQKRFLADASHELKTPIAIIKGMVEILNRDDFEDDEVRKDFLKQIEKENLRLEYIVKDLSELSKLSKYKPLLNRKQVDIKEMLDSCVIGATHLEEYQNINIIQQYEQNYFFCDDEKIKQVVMNLLSNALKYSGASEIIISAFVRQQELCIKVSDNGIGIDEKDIEKIFNRFYRVDSARARNTGGSGLGLTISKAIVEAHNGSIEVSSQVGVGSTFTIVIRNY